MSPGDIALANGSMRLVLRPAWGGRVASLAHERHGDILVPMGRGTFEPENWPRAGAYPLIPFHNRVRDARFTFAGRSARLHPHADALPNALHGMGSRAEWRLTALDDRETEIAFEWESCDEWPWRFSARQHFALGHDRLVLSMSLVNHDAVPMPAGLGWHPYFPGTARCRTDARIAWPIEPDYLPRGTGEPRRELGATAYLSDWGTAAVEMDRLTVRLRAAGMAHLVIHAPPGGSVLCVEPVSHLAGALNEPSRRPGAEEGGMVPLAPGAALTARIELLVEG
ncbi:hypothetical protein D3218_08550 [Aureimonas flava]|uniref:Aldose 1-epimerase n=1 Tax=Aureimonas flava TaxID=2320271 RepID=A0A3A1WLY2_9HYPH|nr:hypothetical protein [Aureimonas flava]RIY01398.1 hypothetical protein D3218_08550 [Aureimonas flava]